MKYEDGDSACVKSTQFGDLHFESAQTSSTYDCFSWLGPIVRMPPLPAHEVCFLIGLAREKVSKDLRTLLPQILGRLSIPRLPWPEFLSVPLHPRVICNGHCKFPVVHVLCAVFPLFVFQQLNGLEQGLYDLDLSMWALDPRRPRYSILCSAFPK